MSLYNEIMQAPLINTEGREFKPYSGVDIMNVLFSYIKDYFEEDPKDLKINTIFEAVNQIKDRATEWCDEKVYYHENKDFYYIDYNNYMKDYFKYYNNSKEMVNCFNHSGNFHYNSNLIIFNKLKERINIKYKNLFLKKEATTNFERIILREYNKNKHGVNGFNACIIQCCEQKLEKIYFWNYINKFNLNIGERNNMYYYFKNNFTYKYARHLFWSLLK